MAHTHLPKTLVGALAIGSKPPTTNELPGVYGMNDDQVRQAFAENRLHKERAIEALRRSGRGELALELDAKYGVTIQVPATKPIAEVEIDVVAEDSESEDSELSELSDVEPSGSGSADESEESADAPVSADSSDSEPSADEQIALKMKGGWYELEDGSKVRKADLPDGAVIVED